MRNSMVKIYKLFLVRYTNKNNSKMKNNLKIIYWLLIKEKQKLHYHNLYSIQQTHKYKNKYKEQINYQNKIQQIICHVLYLIYNQVLNKIVVIKYHNLNILKFRQSYSHYKLNKVIV